MFKVGIYKNQLNLIVLLLVMLMIGQISTWVDNFFQKLYGQEQVITTVKQPVDNNAASFTSNKEISNPALDYGPDEELKEWMEDYQLRITDNGRKLVLYDGSRIVHVFDRAYGGNRNLFQTIDRDNW